MQALRKPISDLVPNVFADLGIKFDTETDEPLLVIKIVKQNGDLNITTKPEFLVYGLADRLRSWKFEEGVVYEIQFIGRNGLGLCKVDDVPTEPSNNLGLSHFLEISFDFCRDVAVDLSKLLENMPSIDGLNKSVGRGVELQLVAAIIEGDSRAFATGPTRVEMICPHEHDDHNAMSEDRSRLVFLAPVRCRHLFFGLAVTILTAAIKALLPGIVREKQDKIATNAEAAIVALLDARRAAAEASVDMTEA